MTKIRDATGQRIQSPWTLQITLKFKSGVQIYIAK
jgi:hypothetical protein